MRNERLIIQIVCSLFGGRREVVKECKAGRVVKFGWHA